VPRRSLELQSDLVAVAAHLCYLHTEHDAPHARDANPGEPASALDPAPAPLNAAAVAAFGGPPAFLRCLLDCPSEHARRCALAVLVDTARGVVLEREPALASILQPRDSTRRVCGMPAVPCALECAATRQQFTAR
jgi:hypothetical protein